MKAARTADKMVAILQQAAANGESHGVIGHGKNICGRIVLHITSWPKTILSGLPPSPSAAVDGHV
jgi:hypothetical protein